RAVREDVDPDLPATLDVARHGDTSGLDLPVRHVGVLERLDAVLTEGDLRAALGVTLALRCVLLTVLDLAWDEHASALRLLCCVRRSDLGAACGRDVCVGLGGTAGLGRRRRGARGTAATPLRALTARRALGRGCGVPLGLGLEAADELALVDPPLYADAAERRLGLEEAVVDVGTQRVQRDPAVAVVLGTGHLGAAETTAALHADALDLRRPHRRLDRLAHGTAERDTVGQLLGDALRDELGVGLGVLDLEDVQLHLLAGQLLQRTTDAVGLGTTTSDDDARTGGVDVDANPVTGALDLHLGDAGPLHARGQELADLH